MKLINAILNYFLINRYKSSGLILGEMLSYSYMGKACGCDKTKKKFLLLQDKIVKRGFAPLSMRDFINSGGWDRPLPLLDKGSETESLTIIQENNEIISLHEAQFSINFSNKI